MKKFTGLLILLILMTSMLLGYRHIQANKAVVAYNQDNLIRFHVVANSDSEADQALKLKVRDVIVNAMGREFAGVENIDDARTITCAELKYIEKLAEQEVAANGEKYPVSVYYDRFPFPTKTYDALTLPAGEYEAVKVVIGEGAGANWWCVLFPPLCFVDESEQGHAAQQNGVFKEASSRSCAEYGTVRVEYRLKIVDLIYDKLFEDKTRKIVPAWKDGEKI